MNKNAIESAIEAIMKDPRVKQVYEECGFFENIAQLLEFYNYYGMEGIIRMYNTVVIPNRDLRTQLNIVSEQLATSKKLCKDLVSLKNEYAELASETLENYSRARDKLKDIFEFMKSN